MLSTYTGRFVNPLALAVADICIEDVAHALACVNRFGGHAKYPISVAQHAVYVSRLVERWGGDRNLQRQGLHHDDAESFVGDMTKWMKETPEMSAYRLAEDVAQRACYAAFGIEPDSYAYDTLKHPLVERADKLMVRFEGLKSYGPTMPLFQRADYPCPTEAECAEVGTWEPVSWSFAQYMFLERFKELAD